MIEVTDLTKDFGKKRALNNLSFKVSPGKAFGLLGRNGAGKTTCIRIIMDIFPADSGKVTIDSHSPRENTRRIGYLPEERGLYPKKTIIEQMIYIGELRGLKSHEAKRNAENLLEQLEATEYLGRKLDTLSKGNQQKIQLAIALINDPEILILDEPFSGLDPVNAHILKKLVSEKVKAGRTVIFSSHQMPAVEEFCDEICIIDNGAAVLTGNLREIKRSYPRNNIYIEAEGNKRQLKDDITRGFKPEEIEESGGGFNVRISDPEQRDGLLRFIADNKIKLDVFSIIEPTLEDIFIEKVGQANESV
ncbi:MAG: ATP-binding cassette domain-containing protein [Clostridiales bacterium]|nr:ATP-binding cassette domain-containing protein [Clostridiales bacterium]